jgi:hypothetical protein
MRPDLIWAFAPAIELIVSLKLQWYAVTTATGLPCIAGLRQCATIFGHFGRVFHGRARGFIIMKFEFAISATGVPPAAA